MRASGTGAASRRALIIAGFTGLALGACQETLSGGEQRALVRAPGVPVSIESIEGGPEAVRNRFAALLDEEAAGRQISLVGRDGAPRYRVRAYLDADLDEEGKARIAWVMDLYDQTKKRARRVEGAVRSGGSGGDPWSGIEAAALKRAASESMNDVAAFLAGGGEEPVAGRE